MARCTERSLHCKCIYAVGYAFVKVQEAIYPFINHQKKIRNGGILQTNLFIFFFNRLNALLIDCLTVLLSTPCIWAIFA